MNASDEDPGHELDIDELATQRARADIERVFAELKIPGRLEDDLFCFDFAALVGRIEILSTPDPTQIHAHMTVSGPKLAVPVLDCWAAFGANHAEALTNAISQWVQGAYWAYHTRSHTITSPRMPSSATEPRFTSSKRRCSGTAKPIPKHSQSSK